MSLQDQIAEVLRSRNGCIKADELVAELQTKNRELGRSQVKAALLPLMST
jgi:hypothetical protein